MLTPDELVNEILRIQNERNPDADPGDITINVQDDMPLCTVHQKNEWIGMGDNLQHALENALNNVTDGRIIDAFSQGI